MTIDCPVCGLGGGPPLVTRLRRDGERERMYIRHLCTTCWTELSGEEQQVLEAREWAVVDAHSQGAMRCQ